MAYVNSDNVKEFLIGKKIVDVISHTPDGITLVLSNKCRLRLKSLVDVVNVGGVTSQEETKKLVEVRYGILATPMNKHKQKTFDTKKVKDVYINEEFI